MQGHTTIGADNLREVDRKHTGNTLVRIGVEIAESHHGKWDGRGYPRGLAGEDTP
jgi:putative two-component system response regulator